MKHRELFRVEGVPVFQNKMFTTEEATCACPNNRHPEGAGCKHPDNDPRRPQHFLFGVRSAAQGSRDRSHDFEEPDGAAGGTAELKTSHFLERDWRMRDKEVNKR
jgi:hypothetical protein